MDSVVSALGHASVFVSSFHFDETTTPLAAPIAPVVTACVLYPAALVLLKLWMSTQKAFELRRVLLLHNIFLVLLSTFMCIGFLYTALVRGFSFLHSDLPFQQDNLDAGVPLTATTSLAHFLICDHSITLYSGAMEFFVYVFYLSKYYELLDTVLLVLRQKPLTFLHVIHHILTLLICWAGLRTSFTVMWIACVVNSAVHVVMYSYYTLALLRIRVWWKKYLTYVQMIQFVGNITGLCVWFYMDYVLKRDSDNRLRCSGDVYVGYCVHAVNMLFLILFLLFFRRTYTPTKAKATSKKMD